ncbi:MAG: sodium:dicarboxylate symporter [Planctomycetes bacterium]|jgi:sodium-dependent dicarboxylate transporter 2/3/5|nr:sodium:dicarboxylate symporter [Planctomycetota bacterium]MDP6425072.1 SLC13 family permease [Planctomycetota bacterium]
MSRSSWLLLIGCLGSLAFGVTCWWLGLDVAATKVAAVTFLTAFLWVTEPIPIPATSLIPFAALPLLGILDHKQVAAAYGDPMVLLLLGGFMLSTAMAKSGAHRRLALGMVRLVGGQGGRRLVLGFMIASAVCSMWISNTATVLMMLPIAMAVLEENDDPGLAVPLMLGVAHASSLGGVATPIGTPPNVIFMKQYEIETGTAWGFVDWMMIGVPIVVLFLPLMWWWLVRHTPKTGRVTLPAQGPWRLAEILVLIVFTLTALLWVTRKEGFGGWSTWLPDPTAVDDGTVALFSVIVLFMLPSGDGGRLLDWKTAAKIPWGLLLLFGGGIAIAHAFKSSGLSETLGEHLAVLARWPLLPTVVVLCLVVTFLTEITSNTATTTLLMPILAAAGTAALIDPSRLMVPAAISASCAYMLPVATAPNAIVFGTGRVTTQEMARSGVALNLIGVVVVTTVCVLAL